MTNQRISKIEELLALYIEIKIDELGKPHNDFFTEQWQIKKNGKLKNILNSLGDESN